MVTVHADIKNKQYVDNGKWSIIFKANKVDVGVGSIEFEAKNLEDAVDSICPDEYSKIVITYTDNG